MGVKEVLRRIGKECNFIGKDSILILRIYKELYQDIRVMENLVIFTFESF